MKKNSGLSVLALGAVFAAAGCGDDAGETRPTFATPPPRAPFRPNAEAGIPVAVSQDPNAFRTLVATRSFRFPSRTDPFALTRREAGFELRQRTEALFTEGGPFVTQFPAPTDPPIIVPVLEPQPYRRLSGIVVGDSVLALIDMGDGSGPIIIRPGMQIPNSPWRVISIDQDKAILRRSGNVLPRQITVRLEVPPPGFGGGGGEGRGGFDNGSGGDNRGVPSGDGDAPGAGLPP